jgi:two-component system LytT family response regulator
MRQISVFILDDDRDAVSRIEILIGNNKNVKICGTETDPERAIPQIRSNRPDLILLDIEMPGMGGFDLLHAIREDGYDPSVIFISGFDQYAIKAIKESALDYLLKPVDAKELNQAIQKYIDRLDKSSKKVHNMLVKLSPREQDVFRYLQAGQTSKQIARVLNISKNTVDTHRRKILKKLNLDSTTQIHLHYPSEK